MSFWPRFLRKFRCVPSRYTTTARTPLPVTSTFFSQEVMFAAALEHMPRELAVALSESGLAEVDGAMGCLGTSSLWLRATGRRFEQHFRTRAASIMPASGVSSVASGGRILFLLQPRRRQVLPRSTYCQSSLASLDYSTRMISKVSTQRCVGVTRHADHLARILRDVIQGRLHCLRLTLPIHVAREMAIKIALLNTLSSLFPWFCANAWFDSVFMNLRQSRRSSSIFPSSFLSGRVIIVTVIVRMRDLRNFPSSYSWVEMLVSQGRTTMISTTAPTFHCHEAEALALWSSRQA